MRLHTTFSATHPQVSANLHFSPYCSEVILETDVLPQCYGSARATVPDDGTDVMASVKVEIGKPDASAPDCGSLEVSASCWASMSASAATRAGDDFAASLTRTLQA